MDGQIVLTIDGRELEAKRGQTILEVAKANGIDIPALCYYPETRKVGACRVCVVEVEGARSLVASCAMPAERGMVVKTATKRVMDARKQGIKVVSHGERKHSLRPVCKGL